MFTTAYLFFSYYKEQGVFYDFFLSSKQKFEACTYIQCKIIEANFGW